MLKHTSSMAQTLRTSAFAICAVLLMACQGETIAQEVDALSLIHI